MFRTNHGNQSHNLAARMGRWAPTTGRPRRSVGSRSSSSPWRSAAWPARSHRPEHGRAARVRSYGQDPRRGLQAPRRRERPRPEPLLSATDPAFTAAVEDVVAGLSKVDVVQNIRSPLDEANAGQIAPNGHAALVEFEIRGPADEAADKLDPVLDQVDAAQKAHPEALHRRVRRRQRRRGDQYGVRGRPGEGRRAVTRSR